MDNIIVNSALWYAEQSSQFLVNSGANKLLDKGYDYYVKEFIPLGTLTANDVARNWNAEHSSEKRICMTTRAVEEAFGSI